MRFERYDRIVEHYPAMWPLLVPGYLPILNAMLDVVRARPTKPTALLDLGCGPGSATVAVAPACDPSGSVVVADGSERMLEAARALLGAQVKTAVAGDYTAPEVARQCFPPAAYDLVLCSFALHHLPDASKRQVIDGIGASLRPGGLLLLADEVVADRPGGWDVVERIRGRIIGDHLAAGRISREFLELESSLPTESLLPFLPSRVEDFTSWMARAELATSCPVSVLGSALLIGVKPE